MRKDEYLSSQTVRDFITWVEMPLDTPRAFIHSYIKKKGKKVYEFDSLYSAYEKYDWPYSIDEYSISLITGIADSDEQACVSACHDILKWGGVFRGNGDRVSRLGQNLSSYLRSVRERLALDLLSKDYFFPGMQMTSGFSKIYSAYIDDYIIYDGRVGAALGLLVKKFCIHNNLPCVPHELRFSWARGLESNTASGSISRRNPSCDKYKFPELVYYRPEEYLENNIRANWLLSAISENTKSKFSGIDKPHRLRSLEQALFMIGYDVSGN
jgi:hypothetical protein